ncbi:chromosomal replication initiator protein DnaA [Eupransor demetentiae]|uniref:Chromosomal replication initiator protein DnaA n=1 Tax=Eupransor demetentiae TaxID=3109584 RepID=A0ABM9N541_9LACO|nr:Chromosomal replication initiation ATPase DnaA (DnaA) [Lactobacillaceae bacterium LMG 33000]
MATDITKDELWNQIQAKFFEKLGPLTFSTYVEPLKPVDLNGASFRLDAPQDTGAEIIDKWNQDLAMDFVQFAMELTTSFIKPTIEIESSRAAQPSPAPANTAGQSIPFSEKSDLNPDFTFEKFVVGSANESAYSVARAVADNPGTVYNPYLIYGGVGLGKTHLMQSIGNAYAKRDPSARIKYVTSEEFTNDFTDSIRAADSDTAISAFKQTYRNVDMLLIDDIQFWAGKDGTQEQFFNTFNTLTKNGKQVVMTSDRMPTDIPELQTRLTSRFEAGIMMDIQKPDLSTRVAILKNLSVTGDLDIPNDVLELIAENIDSNVRSLEGAFHKFEAKIRYMNKPATKETAQQILDDLNIDQNHKVTVDRIQQTVATYFMLTVDDLKSSSRKKDLVTARHIAMYLTRTMTDESLPDIGRAFGGRDHSSVLHATNKITERAESEPRTKDLLTDLANEIKNGK